MGEFNFVPTDTLFAKIEDQLNAYANSGILDVGRFYDEIKWCIAKMGIPAYEPTDAILKLKDYKSEMPCDFFMLDSAWLCDANPVADYIIPQANSKTILYNRQTTELISQNTSCDSSFGKLNYQGVIIESCEGTCNNEQVLEKITAIDYVQTTQPQSFTWKNPILLTYRKNKSVRTYCTKDCKNIFAKSPYEISIEKQGASTYLYSTLKEPIIYLKYYKYPVDLDTGLPMIPDDPIIQKFIEYHLMHYFFYMARLNGDTNDIERIVKDLEEKRNMYMGEAMNYCKFPSFLKSVEMAKRVRRKFAAYEEIFNGRHF
jgi:hypothetical protein